MIDLSILRDNPELAKNINLVISGADLLQFSDEMQKRAVEVERSKRTEIPEEYLTPDEMAKTLKISLVTLWSWDKKEITSPLYIGRQKRYRRGDLDKMLNQR